MVFVFTLLILSVILFSGWSDAAGAITGCISVRSLPPEKAMRMAAVCTWIGSVAITLLGSRIAHTFYSIADFGSDSRTALVSLCAALFSVIVWSFFTRYIGIPISETHALLSGMSGAAIATKMSFSALNLGEWKRIFLGFLLSTVPTLLLSFGFNRILHIFLARKNRRSAMLYFVRSQRFSAAWNTALHGAQDCQKFMGVYMLGMALCQGQGVHSPTDIPLSVILLCASVMAMGTLLGGTHVIKKIGRDMTEPDAPSYSAAGAASSLVMTLCTFCGLPASITHARACGFIGSAMGKKSGVDLRVVGQLFFVWLLTFPICAAIAFFFSFVMTHV